MANSNSTTLRRIRLVSSDHTPTLTSIKAICYDFRGGEHADDNATLPEIAALPAAAWKPQASTHYASFNRTDVF